MAFLFCGSVFADWTEWTPLQSVQPEDSAIKFRSTRDGDPAAPAGDAGYRFLFELRNESSTHAAKVSLGFPHRDPQSGLWSEASAKGTTVIALKPGAVTSGAEYSPNPSTIDYVSAIEWTEDPDGRAPAEPGSEGGAAVPEPGSGDKDPVLGVPLNDNEAVIAALGADPTALYDGVIAFTMDDFHSDLEAYKRDMVEACANDHSVRSRVIDAKDNEVYVLYEGIHGPDLAAWLTPSAISSRRLVRITRLGESADRANPVSSAAATAVAAPPGNGPLTEENIKGKDVPGSGAPALHAGSMAAKPAPTTQHYGYWFDPGDAEAEGDNPMIYVRVDGTAIRMRLRVAKSEYGVPDTASPATMTHYSEAAHKILKDRGTHRE